MVSEVKNEIKMVQSFLSTKKNSMHCDNLP
jgi:hypothetical protein